MIQPFDLLVRKCFSAVVVVFRTNVSCSVCPAAGCALKGRVGSTGTRVDQTINSVIVCCKHWYRVAHHWMQYIVHSEI